VSGIENTFFGQFLLAEGLVTAPQLLAAVEYQDQFNSRLGEYAVALGCITNFEAEQINALQVSRNLKFGEAAMELGLFDREQLQEIIKKQRNEHVMLGTALAKLGYVDEEKVQDAFRRFLDRQQEYGLELPAEHPYPELGRAVFGEVGRLLLRAWGLPSKPQRLQARHQLFLLSDYNALVEIGGGATAALALGIPLAVAKKGLSASGDPEASENSFEAAVAGLLQQLVDNVAASLAATGCKLELGRPRACGFQVRLDRPRSALVVPYLTHDGQVIAALIT